MSEHIGNNNGEIPWCRDRLERFAIGNGCDCGFGGAILKPSTICIDRPEGHPERAVVKPPVPPTHFAGDVRDLPFKDGVLDYVFSSHCLEDFENTREIMKEWIRVLKKPGGRLILFLPDQQTYVRYCQSHGEVPNAAHKIPHFSLEYVKQCANGLGVKVVYELWPVPGTYSFDVVFECV